MPQRELFPVNLPLVIEHNTNLLTKYYTNYQHQHYRKIIDTHFTSIQNRDTRSIPPPETIPYSQIVISECDPEKDINTT